MVQTCRTMPCCCKVTNCATAAETPFFRKIWFIAAVAIGALVVLGLAFCFCCRKKKAEPNDIIMPAHGSLSVSVSRPPPTVPQATAPLMEHVPLNSAAPQRQQSTQRPLQQPTRAGSNPIIASAAQDGIQSVLQIPSEHLVYYSELEIVRFIPGSRRTGEKSVHYGKCQGREVAILTLPAARMRNGLAEKFSRTGRHPSIVDFVAISETPDRHLVVVMSWLAHGSIIKFLREHDGFFGATEKLEAVKQIGKAMKWLSDEGIVQGRLAARNVLVASPLPVTVQLSDYLLSGQSGFSEVNPDVDTRWAAPEALQSNMWSLSSDIWAFGIVMWEIFSGAKTPYLPANQTDEEVSVFVTEGGRLQCPPNCSRSIYTVMYSCWEAASSRPSFESLLQSLESVEKGGVEVLDIPNDELEAFTDVGDMSLEDAKMMDAGQCQMCLSAPREVMCLPCRHACLCKDCFDMIMERDKLCIICRNVIESSRTGNFVQTYQKGTIAGF